VGVRREREREREREKMIPNTSHRRREMNL
jgi:hypothetical protein